MAGSVVYRFLDFELHEERRELRLAGRELLLQPRVFDLLAYLVRHRDRVVAKEELLEALWPDVIVGDGSIQRAMSLARSALRAGRADGLIRTFSRQGYRFCGDTETLAAAEPATGGAPLSAALARARDAWSTCRWLEVTAAYGDADQDDQLTTADLERWATALSCLGRGAAAVPLLERAVAAHSTVGDIRGVARAALLLCRILFERTMMAAARGWHRRALALLADRDLSAEHGHAAWLAARFALVEGEVDSGVKQAERAVEIGKEIDDVDVVTIGLLYLGHALLARGETKAGQALHDEAAATVLGGGVTPYAGGLAYCGVIWACRNRGDWERATQWSEQFVRWCDRSGMAGYPGTCQLHHAEVAAMQGKIVQAEEEARNACSELAVSAPWAVGDAWRLRGDLDLLRGDSASAELSYREAHGAGWDPNPGLAQLQAEAGDPDGALRSLERSADDPSWSGRERRYLVLARLVLIAAAAGDLARAEAGHRELVSAIDEAATPAMLAWLAHATGELHLGGGDTAGAVAAWREAFRLWQSVGSPLQTAAIREALARAYACDGDLSAAALELDAAAATYRALALDVPLARCQKPLGIDRVE